MLAAIRRSSGGDSGGSSGARSEAVVRGEIQALLSAFQIKSQRLAVLLEECL